MATRDQLSVTENPTFASTTGSSSSFLHFAAATSTLAESGGVNIATFTNDYDADIRQGNGGYTGTGVAPDIGADEFEGTNPSFVALDMGATALVAPSATGCYTATETVTVTVKNYGTALIDFAVNPTTVTVNVTGAVTTSLSATLSSGTLASGATQNVNMSSTLNMTTAGTYVLNGTTSVSR
ncbi:MAG: hypothetical protein IPL24_05390 [Bacteroidetes bacterium]|nr:hypothetical protein [Bacteroidota bacterium]